MVALSIEDGRVLERAAHFSEAGTRPKPHNWRRFASLIERGLIELEPPGPPGWKREGFVATLAGIEALAVGESER